MKLLIMLSLLLTVNAIACPKETITPDQAETRITEVSDQLKGEDWDSSEICTNRKLVKKYDLKQVCKTLGY